MRENRRRKYLTFGMSVYDITLRVYLIVQPRDTLEIKNALAVCLLRHLVHHRSLTVFETACLQQRLTLACPDTWNVRCFSSKTY
jgi:hypothetical protein